MAYKYLNKINVYLPMKRKESNVDLKVSSKRLKSEYSYTYNFNSEMNKLINLDTKVEQTLIPIFLGANSLFFELDSDTYMKVIRCSFLKITDQNNFDSEVTAAKKAADLGIGPKIISYGKLYYNDILTYYIKMEKLKGKQLSTLAFENPEKYCQEYWKNKVCSLFTKLKENNILPQDINSGSVFVVKDKLYFLDYDMEDRDYGYKGEADVICRIWWENTIFCD